MFSKRHAREYGVRKQDSEYRKAAAYLQVADIGEVSSILLYAVFVWRMTLQISSGPNLSVCIAFRFISRTNGWRQKMGRPLNFSKDMEETISISTSSN